MRIFVTISLATLFLSCVQVFGQAPQGINYQGVARDLDGQPLSQKEISIRISILNESASGELEYDEIHEVKTNSFGLFTLVIGQGTPGTSSFNFISWTSGTKWLQIELDENGGRNFELMGSQQLMSVPYALYAERSGNGYQAGQGISISNNLISNLGDGDNDATNELIGSVTFDADNKLQITDAGGSKEVDLSGLIGGAQNLGNVLTQGNDAGSTTITNLGAPVTATDAATKAYVDGHTDGDASSVNEIQNLAEVLAQGSDAGGSKISSLGAPTLNSDAATKFYVDNLDAADGDKDATNEIQNISQVLVQGNNAGGTKITNLGAPTLNTDATTKLYVDNLDSADGDKNATNEIQNISQVLVQGNNAGGTKITNLGVPTLNTDATTKLYVDNLDAADGDKDATNEIQNIAQVLTQGNNAGGTKITNLGSPTLNTDASTKLYVDNLDAADGDKNATNEIQNLSQVLAQNNSAGTSSIIDLADPTNAQDATTKNYVDAADNALSLKIANNYAFKAIYDHTHTVPTIQIVTIASEEFDDFSLITGNSFISPESGTYQFTVSGTSPLGGISMQIRVTPVSGPAQFIDVKRQIGYPISSIINYYDSTILKLDTGDIVELVVTSGITNEVVVGTFYGFKL